MNFEKYTKLHKPAPNSWQTLLPCPFCGCEEIVYAQYDHAVGERWAVLCTGCMASIDPGFAQGRGVVQQMWNRRTGEPVHSGTDHTEEDGAQQNNILLRDVLLDCLTGCALAINQAEAERRKVDLTAWHAVIATAKRHGFLFRFCTHGRNIHTVSLDGVERVVDADEKEGES